MFGKNHRTPRTHWFVIENGFSLALWVLPLNSSLDKELKIECDLKL